MQSLAAANLFRGYHVGSQNEVPLTHLQFADDTLIIREKSWSNVRYMRVALLIFEAVSGLKVNFHKSMLTGVNVSESWLTEAASVMNCRTGKITFMYLGCLLVVICADVTFGNLCLTALCLVCRCGKLSFYLLEVD